MIKAASQAFIKRVLKKFEAPEMLPYISGLHTQRDGVDDPSGYGQIEGDDRPAFVRRDDSNFRAIGDE